MSEPEFKQWVVIELLGHRKLSGYASEAVIAGAKFIQIDIYTCDAVSPVATQFYSPNSVYCITPTTEAIAKNLATLYSPAPNASMELSGSDYDDIDDEDFPA